MTDTPNTSPERIWLQDNGEWSDQAYRMGAITWCDHAVNDDDTEYVRADLPPTRAAALEVPEVRAMIRALERAEAAFADIAEGEPERDEKTEIRFCKRRAGEELQVSRAALAELEKARGG